MSLSTLLIIVLSMALAFGVDLERESATRDIRRNKALIRPYACMHACSPMDNSTMPDRIDR
jgi:hypothetical protein